jgi:pectinesterase
MGKSVNVVGGFLVVLLCCLGCLQVGLAQSSANAKRIAISWDDMKMNKRGARMSSKYDFNRSRVIVVDKNGGADSLTVQGAIDLVPQYNTQRVKIYIHPGIYRFAELFFFP